MRQLTEQDDAIFSAFESSASEQDLDDAYVELDHWAVFGSFEQNRLVCAASMYPWGEDVQIADLGILTLSAYRGKGHARKWCVQSANMPMSRDSNHSTDASSVTRLQHC